MVEVLPLAEAFVEDRSVVDHQAVEHPVELLGVDPVAQRGGDYRAFITADLNEPLDIPSASYAGASCCGTFTRGHVGAECQDELFRILKPGAPFAFTVKLEVLESLRFKAKRAALMAAGKITERAFMLDRHYATSEQPDGVFCVYARA